MRIGYDAKRYYHNRTGLGNYSRDLIRILGKYYPQHKYLLYTPKAGNSSAISDSVEQRLPQGIWKGLLGSLWRRTALRKDLVRDKVDIYHGLSGELPSGIEKTGISSVVTIHDLIFEHFPELYKPFDRKMHRFKFQNAARKADVVVAISKQTKDDLIRLYGIEEDKIRVIYQICAPIFKQVLSENHLQKVRNKYDLNGPFILQVGTIEERKNAALAVQALPMIPDVELILVGKTTEYWDRVKQIAENSGVSNRLRRLTIDNNEELAAVFKLAKIFSYPSRIEGFGIPILEALSSGVPVITTAGGVFFEAAGSGSAYVDPDDPVKFADLANDILGNKSLSGKMIAHGLEHAARFDEQMIAGQWMDLYDSLLSKNR